jgi:hypothetical protein
MFINWYKLAQEEYQGEHSAPIKHEDYAPLHDLTKLYPDDIYSSDAARLYGDGVSYDNESIAIIQSCRNRPNKQVKIYRAVPNLNAENEAKLKNLYELTYYVNQFGFLPISDNPKTKHLTIPKEITPEIRLDKNKILEKLNELEEKEESNKKSPIKINPGDWVSTSLSYAKDHGQSNLRNNYKIRSKTVTAKELYTDANSIHEWGYNP